MASKQKSISFFLQLQVALLLTSFLGACASQSVLDDVRVRRVQSAALIGFEIQQEMPIEISASKLFLGGSSDDGANIPVPELSSHALQGFQDANEVLTREFKWKSIPYEKLIKNTSYKAAFQDRMTGFRNIPPVHKDWKLFEARDVLDWTAVNRLSAEQRAELAKSLGVEALVALQVRAESAEKASLLNLAKGAKFQPFANVSLVIYDSGGQVVLWRENAFKGATVQEGGSQVGGSENSGRVNQAVLEAARLAYKTWIEKYRTLGKTSAAQ